MMIVKKKTMKMAMKMKKMMKQHRLKRISSRPDKPIPTSPPFFTTCAISHRDATNTTASAAMAAAAAAALAVGKT